MSREFIVDTFATLVQPLFQQHSASWVGAFTNDCGTVTVVLLKTMRRDFDEEKLDLLGLAAFTNDRRAVVSSCKKTLPTRSLFLFSTPEESNVVARAEV